MKREILFKGKSVNTGEWVESMTIAKGTIKRKKDDVFMEIDEKQMGWHCSKFIKPIYKPKG